MSAGVTNRLHHNAVNSKDDVGELDNQKHKEQRSHEVAPVKMDKEAVVAHFAGDWEETARQLDHRMVGSIYLLVHLVEEHLDTTVYQYNTAKQECRRQLRRGQRVSVGNYREVVAQE